MYLFLYVLVVWAALLIAQSLLFSVFGIFFSDESNDPNAVSPSVAVAQINREYADTLSGYQTGGSYDSVEIIGRPPSWVDVFAVFTVKTVTGDGMDVVVLDANRVERLRTVFWDMTKITTETKTVDHPATEDADAWTETVLVITVTPRTTDDMRVFYEPRPGDLVFFDWDNKGSSGPQDDVPDHVGIVERVENGILYTVEGNSSDSCRQRSYSVGYYEIWGYGCPTF